MQSPRYLSKGKGAFVEKAVRRPYLNASRSVRYAYSYTGGYPYASPCSKQAKRRDIGHAWEK